MNERDSEALACMLRERGWTQVGDEEAADILLFNTCSVRDQAERKAIGKVGLMKRLKRRRPDVVIGVLGCMAQNYGEELLATVPHIDLVVGTDNLHRLPEMLDAVLQGDRPQVNVETGTDLLGQLRGHPNTSVSAYVSVMRGCDQFCSYCIVPYVRGREKSRAIEDIVAEATDLAHRGTREIFLLGQNVTAYGLAEARREGTFSPEMSPFADLLRAVNGIDGVERIRFTSPHPTFMNDAFMDAVCSLPAVCEGLHIPLQSGSNRMLKAMNRGYTADEYAEKVRTIQSRMPGVVLSTDVIVGYPGETEADFESTREMMNDIGFEMAYIFKYSPRAGTRAARLADDVPTEVKEARNQVLLQDLAARSEGANRACRGTDVEVLVEGESKRNTARWTGRTRTGKVCIFEPRPGVAVGDLVTVRVTGTTAYSLYGSVSGTGNDEC